MSDGRCADVSAAVGESLAATATTAQSWLLVEVRGTWPRDVSAGDGLAEPARAAVEHWRAATPDGRVMFVRRPGRARDSRLVFVVEAAEDSGEVRRIEVEQLDDLEAVDLAVDGNRVSSPLVLVCGHGTRDSCCALRGTAVYGALAELLGDEELWLSSHQGGHRFAANVLVLPSGIQLGRVPPGAAPKVVGHALAGRISLEHYRGRTAYSPCAQAAELAVRSAERLTELEALRLRDDNGTRVVFQEPDGREHVATVAEVAGPLVPASCGAIPEAQRHLQARLV